MTRFALHVTSALLVLLVTVSAFAHNVFNPEDLKNVWDWKRRYFDVMIVLNKAANLQTLDVYRFGVLVKSVRTAIGGEAPTGYFSASRQEIDQVLSNLRLQEQDAK